MEEENRILPLRIRKIKSILFEENPLNLEFIGFLIISPLVISKKYPTNIKFDPPFEKEKILFIEKLITDFSFI